MFIRWQLYCSSRKAS